MKEFENKTILITGASSGIGKTFAKALDKLGAKLILTARSENKLNDLASSMNDAIVISGDLLYSTKTLLNKLKPDDKKKGN